MKSLDIIKQLNDVGINEIKFLNTLWKKIPLYF
jgi:hypothetical protein